jgi:repressor LexA
MNRLKILREEKGLSQPDMAKFLNISVPGYSYYENEKRDMSTEIQKKLANFFNVSIDYLVGNSNERQSNTNLLNKLFLIPIVGKVPAGEPLLAEDNIEGYLPIDPMMYNLSSPDNLFFLKVVGESMNNIVPNGSFVLVRKQDSAEDGDVIVAIVNGDDEATLKRFKQLESSFVMLEPDSSFPEYTPRIVNLRDTEFKIIGKVIGDFKKWS